MGVADWKIDCCQALAAEGVDLVPQLKQSSCFQLTAYTCLRLIALEEADSPDANFCNAENHLQINLWEDVWKSRRTQVISRIKSLAGLNRTIHARKCRSAIIDHEIAAEFLKSHHLLGTVRTKYAVGLQEQENLVAVATFNMRKMPSRGSAYYSAELVRTCTISGATVTGGLSKLLHYFVKTYQPDDIMTYADKDWSDGNSYLKLGFTFVGETPPLEFYVDPATYNRSLLNKVNLSKTGTDQEIEASLAELGYMRVFNCGNKKYVWYIK